jgi:uncharacterized protein DUF3592
MIPRIAAPETLLATAAVALAGALTVVMVRRWRWKSPEELERLRRLEVHRRGRLVTGEILDFFEPPPGKAGTRLITYKYKVGGVAYEAAQDISALPGVVKVARRAAGQSVNLKYDPRRPTNSILACEEWSGVPELDGAGKPSAGGRRSPSDKRVEQP